MNCGVALSRVTPLDFAEKSLQHLFMPKAVYHLLQ